MLGSKLGTSEGFIESEGKKLGPLDGGDVGELLGTPVGITEGAILGRRLGPFNTEGNIVGRLLGDIDTDGVSLASREGVILGT